MPLGGGGSAVPTSDTGRDAANVVVSVLAEVKRDNGFHSFPFQPSRTLTHHPRRRVGSQNYTLRVDTLVATTAGGTSARLLNVRVVHHLALRVLSAILSSSISRPGMSGFRSESAMPSSGRSQKSSSCFAWGSGSGCA